MSSNHISPDAELLLDEQSCTWRERDVPLRERGISLRWLIAFVHSIYRRVNDPLVATYRDELREYDRALAQQRASLQGPWSNVPWIDAVHPEEPELLELTTRALVAEHVVPLTRSIRAPLYARVPLSQRGKPTAFLSHAWDATVLGLPQAGRRGTLDAFGPGISGVKEEFVWIDFVCYNQHELPEESIAFDMEAIVSSIGKVAFAVTPVALFDRIWCLWELLSVSRNRCKTQFCVAPGYRTDKRMIVNNFFGSFKSVTDAKATKPEDYERLLTAITSHFGSAIAADDYIRDLMRLRMGHWWYELYTQNQERANKTDLEE